MKHASSGPSVCPPNLIETAVAKAAPDELRSARPLQMGEQLQCSCIIVPAIRLHNSVKHLYCSQLVVPSNRGTFVDVNAACRGACTTCGTAGFLKRRFSSRSFDPAAFVPPCPLIYQPAIQCPSDGLDHYPVNGPP